MSRQNLCGSFLIAVLCFVPALAQEMPQALVLGKVVERALSGGHMHTYTLDLPVDRIVRVIAEQKGVDLVLSVSAPDGRWMFDIDSPNGARGDEIAIIAARQGGIYRVEVSAPDKTAASGRYAIQIDNYLTDMEYTTERLAALGRVWGAARFFHPALVFARIDWDGALIQAIPKVKAARTPQEYRDAVNGMLQALGDPATSAEIPNIAKQRAARAAAADLKPPTPVYFHNVDGFLVIHVVDLIMARSRNDTDAFVKHSQMLKGLGSEKGVILDCRSAGISFGGTILEYYLSSYLDGLLPDLVQGEVRLGTERYRQHNGFAPQIGSSSEYASSVVTLAPGAILGRAEKTKPLAVLIDGGTPNLLPLLSGLQARGARIVQVGANDNPAGVLRQQISLPDGVRAYLRVSESVYPSGGSQFRPDILMESEKGAGEGAVKTAVAALSAPSSENRAAASPPQAQAIQEPKDDPYPKMSFPAEEYRLLALFRFWNVIQYFYPYKHLLDRPWGTVPTDFIPKFLENKNALDYEMTVAELAARIQDSHGIVFGLRNLEAHLGAFAPPLRLARSGKRLAVAEVLDKDAAQASGIQPDDVILAVDGEPIESRLAYLARFRSLSTPQSSYAYIYPMALRGDKDSKARLRVEGPDGSVREVELARTLPAGQVAAMSPRKTPIYQVMPDGYGYIDLARLPLADAHKAVDAVMKTPAIIFDMRGYPRGTAWAIAPRLSDKEDVTVALFRVPLQRGINLVNEDLSGRAPDYAFEQKLSAPQGAIYRGKVVMLINENALSQAEHTCLFFEAATDVTFVGSPTNGANGDVTNLWLPGGISVYFTGYDVRHADGRQLQRVGIQPHIKVEPTPKGIREGRDEVLEAAIKFLDGSLKKQHP